MRKERPSALDPDMLVITLLRLLTAEPRRLAEFIDATGLSPGTLRARSADGSLAAALFHYVLDKEALLIEAATALACPPVALAAALRRSDPTDLRSEP